ncbi:MAG: hypothetical protein NPIRA01_25080 [Nitrospirales bacterium]|nr:MAG: hypothetical protein NPIRA01_25080 [Nitrospirales bacterium]
MKSQIYFFFAFCSICGIVGTLPACLATPQVETPIHESPQGQVLLKTFPDTAVKASHPTFIEITLLTETFRGLHVLEEKPLLATLVSGEEEELPVLTEQEIQFLMPWLIDALAQATPEEYVWFQLTNQKPSGPQATSGSLYVSKNFLRIALHTFQADRRQSKLSSKASFSPTHIRHWELKFSPDAALKQSANTQEIFSQDSIGVVVVDLTVLGARKKHQERTSQPELRLQREFKVQDPNSREKQNLRNEIKELQQQLDEQNKTLRELNKRFDQQQEQ